MQLPRPATSLMPPLRHARFRQLWLANMLSNLGSWVQAFAAAWQIATLSRSPLLTSLVQTATWAPMLLLALPAGVLADRMHRPTLLLRSNAVMALAACVMAALALGNVHSAAPLLLLTLLMGAGAAFTLPAWQASMPELMRPEEVEAAATLNNLSYNLAALLGPALGGVLFKLVGPAPLYLFNALSFCALLYRYRRWCEAEPVHAPAPACRSPSLRNTIALACQSRRYRQLLMSTAGIFFVSAAFAALLPLLAHDAHGMDASRYGTLMGALGAGAVAAIAVLPRLRQHLARRSLLAAALCVYGGMLATVALTRSWPLQLLLVGCGGVAWSAIVTSLNSTAQSAFPSAVRARTLSFYIMAAAAGQTAGSAAWGQLANRLGVSTALAAAGAAMLACALTVRFSADFLEHP